LSSSAFRHHRLPRKSAVALLTLGIVTALATPAFAHTPDLTGEVVCATNGHQVVTWTVTNSETVEGSNLTMTVDEITVSSGTVDPISAGTVFPPQPEAGSTQTATTDLPGSEAGVVTLTVAGTWSDDWKESQSASVTLPGTCEEPVTTTTTLPPTTTTTQAPLTVAAAPTTTTTTTAAPQVLGEVLVAPVVAPAAELPRTGAPINTTLLTGAIALMLGAAALRFGKKKTAA
jgi:LPXTG-motif cell wall-anchored protein